jgi:hypothetical protein
MQVIKELNRKGLHEMTFYKCGALHSDVFRGPINSLEAL